MIHRPLASTRHHDGDPCIYCGARPVPMVPASGVSGVRRYVAATVDVEAIRFDGNNGDAIRRWSGDGVIPSPVLEPTPANPSGAYLQVRGTYPALVGDWVVRCVEGGECWTVDHDVFAANYQPKGEAMEQKPSQGRVVIFVERDYASATSDEVKLATWPATVVIIHPDGRVGLDVTKPYGMHEWHEAVEYSAEPQAASWHWPPRVA